MGVWDAVWTGVTKTYEAGKRLVSSATAALARVGKQVLRAVRNTFSGPAKTRTRRPSQSLQRREVVQPVSAQPPSILDQLAEVARRERQEREQVERLLSDLEQIERQTQVLLKKAEIEDFEDYLLKMLAHKLARDVAKAIRKDPTIRSVSQTDVDVCRLVSKLTGEGLEEHEISRFDELLRQKYGMNSIALGMEQLLLLWVQNMQEVEAELRLMRMDKSDLGMDLDVLEEHRKTAPLTEEEARRLEEVRKSLGEVGGEVRRLEQRQSDLREMIGALEGLLLFRENEGEYAYLAEQAFEVSRILFNWHRGEAVSAEERRTVREFAETHIAPARARGRRLINEVGVGVGL